MLTAQGVIRMVLYIYMYDNTPVWEREYPIHDPSPNDNNNDLYLLESSAQTAWARDLSR